MEPESNIWSPNPTFGARIQHKQQYYKVQKGMVFGAHTASGKNMFGFNMASSWRPDRLDFEIPTSSQHRLKIDMFTPVGSISIQNWRTRDRPSECHGQGLGMPRSGNQNATVGCLACHLLAVSIFLILIIFYSSPAAPCRSDGGVSWPQAAPFCTSIDLEKFSLADFSLHAGSTPWTSLGGRSWA